MEPATLNVKVKTVSTTAKQVKDVDGDTQTMRLGKLVLEFDADGVDTDRIKDMIGDEPIVLALAGSQADFLQRVDGQTGEIIGA